MCLVIFLLIFLLKKFNQPYLIAYIIAGILLGPHIGHVFISADQIAALGDIGILLLMFFLGMEIDIPDNQSFLRQPFIAQGIKTLFSLVFAVCIGRLLNWPASDILLLSIIFIFNSTAVVSEFLRKHGETKTSIGKITLNILLLQDIMLAPVFTIFQFMGHGSVDTAKLIISLIVCVLIILLLRSIRNRNLVQFPFLREMKDDHELQVFAAGLICLGFALIFSVVGLSAAIGSFVAGVYVGRINAFHWLEQVLKPFKVFFVALFFVSVGLQLDLVYIWSNRRVIVFITIFVLLINSLLSAFVFKLLNYSWRNSIYAGALLSQTGEFGILACSFTYELGIIEVNFYKSALAVTGLSLLLSTVWMTVLRKFIFINAPALTISKSK
jgi:monovalent cation:H+ antiporter-2, CPA2 family